MKPVPRNVILDLLPVYIAGEASEESRALVEAFAQDDPQIASLIRTGALEALSLSAKVDPPDDLEMKAIKRVRGRIRRQMGYVAIATAALLMVPLVAMLFTNEVNWSVFDFVIMGILLSGTGLAYVLLSNSSEHTAYRAGIGVALAGAFLLIWVNGAVGVIGSENNPANLLYGGVLAVGLIGAGIARFQPRGMAHTLFATALAQMLVPVLAMMIWSPPLEEPLGIVGVFMLNAFFAAFFVVSALLFRRAAQQ